MFFSNTMLTILEIVYLTRQQNERSLGTYINNIDINDIRRIKKCHPIQNKTDKELIKQKDIKLVF